MYRAEVHVKTKETGDLVLRFGLDPLFQTKEAAEKALVEWPDKHVWQLDAKLFGHVFGEDSEGYWEQETSFAL